MENPHVQATLIEIVEHQVRDNDPPETRQTLDRLLAMCSSPEVARRPNPWRPGDPMCHTSRQAWGRDAHTESFMSTKSRFRFRQHDRIGDPSAELDQFLATCFIDNGNIDILRDCADQRALVVGRTGSGKSALLRKLPDVEERVIEIDLHGLALGYIANSAILTFFAELGVPMDQFYKVLWRHVFVVELLKRHYRLESEEDKLNLFFRLSDGILRKRSRIEAFEYLNKWGTKFWTTTEERIKETTVVIERELSTKAGLELAHIATLQAGGKLHLTEQQTKEIERRGKDIVNDVQMSKLSALLDALDEDILTDPQQRYYIVVDRLDEPWVDERYRHRLIRGLIETVKDINTKVAHMKVIVALRSDLLVRVYKAASDSGFQEEKYSGLNLAITWSRKDLCRLLDTRVQELVRQRYTQQKVTLADILPEIMGKRKEAQTAIEYLLDRTLLRPRDAIQFLNACLAQAVDEPMITIQRLLRAEAEYSTQRRAALADEWSQHYPYLLLLTDLLKGRASHFALHEITRNQLDTICLTLEGEEDAKTYGLDYQAFRRYFDGGLGEREVRALLAQWFYTVGLVGLKLASHMEVTWSTAGPVAVNSAEVHDDILLYVHPAFWRVLGIKDVMMTAEW